MSSRGDYPFLYRLGFQPWDKTPGPEILGRVVEGPEALPAGRALDVGCGTGRDGVYLTGLGWRVTGVDGVEKALAQARERAATAGAEVDWRLGDVTELDTLGLEPGYSLLSDIGCFHGLREEDARREAAGLTALAAPGATLVMLAMRRGRRIVLPHGLEREEIERLFGDAWELTDVYQLEHPDMPRPVRKARPTIYALKRTQEGQHGP